MSINNKQHQCSKCERIYEYYYNLRKHVMKAHPEKIDEIAPPVKGPKLKIHQCHLCDKKFTLKQNLKSHMLKLHNIDKNNENVKSLVGMKNVSVSSEDRHFPSFTSFLAWKNSIENETKFSFVKKRGFYLAANKKKIYYYVCHRSGFFVSESKGIRRMRKGSIKIDGVCPASIKVTENEDGSCKINYIATHTCHQKELCNLYLTDLERKSLASDIACNIPFDIVLDKVRNSVTGLRLEQMQLITKQELNKIENDFELISKSVRHQENSPDIEAWVNEVNECDPPCILFYKPQGTVSEKHSNLSSNDFFLIVMNNVQCEMLKKFGSDCIYFDRIHGLDSCFQLITLLVVDDLKQGFPCAFLISNRSDQEILSIFFNYIKTEAGCISTKAIISDLAEEFSNAWNAVMGTATTGLYNYWYVDRSWRKNIQSKVNEIEIQTRVYKMITALMQETDRVTFERLFPLVIRNLRDDRDTLNFAEYFQENYSKNVRLWAYCYRINGGLNTNIHIEKLHGTLKYIWSFQEHLKQLDKAVYVLMRFVRDTFFDRLIVLSKGKQTNIIKEIRKRHVTNPEISKDMIIGEENGWKIESPASSNILNVYLVKKNVNDCNCSLICSNCGSCIHMYTCSCLDSCLKWNMCKHIHSICQLNQIQPQESNANVMLTIEIEEDLIDHDEAEIFTQICSGKLPDELLQNEKEKIKHRLINLIDGLSTTAEIDVLKNHAASLEATINIVRSQTKPGLFHPETAHLERNTAL